MNSAKAMYDFWNSFGIKAYEENSVPTGEFAPKYPYIAYQLEFGNCGSDTYLTAFMYDKDIDGYSALNNLINKSEEIKRAIGRAETGGKVLKCDDGRIRIKCGNPFSSIVPASNTDDTIKRVVINIIVDYHTY